MVVCRPLRYRTLILVRFIPSAGSMETPGPEGSGAWHGSVSWKGQVRVKHAIAVMHPYWRFWEASAGGPAFRDERQRLLDEVVDVLGGPGVDIVWSGLVDSPVAGSEAAADIRAGGASVVLVVQSMAVPPTHAMAALDVLDDLPVVVWAVQRSRALRAAFDQSDITKLGATVGTPMVTNVLGRQGRPFELVVGALEDPQVTERLGGVLRAAATARLVSGARIARVGRPIEGYDCVDVDDAALRSATGIQLVPVEPAEIRDRYRLVGSSSDLEDEVAAGFDCLADRTEGWARSLRLARAMEDLDREHGFAAGAMNCHVEEIRFGDHPGVTPCFGLGRETSRGIPWSCAGDVVTAVAMLVARHLGGAALYHEVEAIDFETEEVVLANSGEHDLGWCPPGVRPRLISNPWYRSDPAAGICAWFELPAGTATLVGFTPHHAEASGFRLIAAEGEVTGRSFPQSPTVGGAFRFSGNEPVEWVWKRWAEAGVNHHSAAAPGHLADQVEVVARFLGVGFVRVS